MSHVVLAELVANASSVDVADGQSVRPRAALANRKSMVLEVSVRGCDPLTMPKTA